MENVSSSSAYQVTISRDSFLSAISLFLRTFRNKKAQSNRVRLYFDGPQFRIAWDHANVAVDATGIWPQPISLSGKEFCAICKFPPPEDPLSFEIRDDRFFCGTWSCICCIAKPLTGNKAVLAISKKNSNTGRITAPSIEKQSFSANQSAVEQSKAACPIKQKSGPMTQPIRNILRDLDNIRENLLAFSDDVWLGIDHNDTKAMKAGIAFKEKLNTQLDAFGKLSDEMNRLVQEYTQVQTEGEASPETEIGVTVADNTRIIRDLNRSEPHALTEDFTYMRPCGFVLDGKGYQDITTWTRVYELVVRHLAKKDPALFKALPDNPATITKRGNRHFSRTPTDLRKPLALPNGIHAESNLSANDLCSSIRTLLEIFALPLTACTIFLRQDRDA